MRFFFDRVRLLDGRGGEAETASLLTEGDRIAAVGDLPPPADAVRIAGEGLTLAPGFIDAHGHSDLSLAASPGGFGKIAQGITCEVSGNCGLSPFPLTDRNRPHLADLYRAYGVPLTWNDLAGYQAMLAARGAVLPLLPLCGHNTLRAAVAGYEKTRLLPEERRQMARLLEEALEAGARGLSFGLLYVPGCFAPPEEWRELMKIVARHDRIAAFHLRSEGDELLEALRETIDAARAAGLARLHISHLKTAGPANWHKLDAVLEEIAAARASGLRVTCDRYPYCASATQFSVIAPGRFREMDDSRLAAELQSPAAFDELAAALAASGRDWNTVILASTAAPEWRSSCGRTVAEIAAEHHQQPALTAAQILRADPLSATGAFRGMSPENLRRILALPYCCCGTDESARPQDESIGRSHPRGFGSMPRFFRSLLEIGLSEGEAVRRMTSLPAEIFRLDDRGTLAPGLRADLVLFDPAAFDSPATFTAPHLPATGLSGVWIAGSRVL